MAIRQNRIESFRDDLIGARVDVASVDEAIMDDPVKLLEWLAKQGGISEPAQRSPEKPNAQRKRAVPVATRSPKKSAASRSQINLDEGRDKIAVHSKLSGNVTISVDEVVFARAYGNDTSIDTYDNWYICSMQFMKFSKYLSGGAFAFVNDGRGFVGAARTSEVSKVTEREDGVFEVYIDISDTTIESVGKPREWYVDTFGEDKVTLFGEVAELEQPNYPSEEASVEENVQVTSPELVGLLYGIACDGRVNICEAKMLRKWLAQFDSSGDAQVQEIKDLLEKVLDDDIVTEEEEREMLLLFNRIAGIVSDDIPSQQQDAEDSEVQEGDTISEGVSETEQDFDSPDDIAHENAPESESELLPVTKSFVSPVVRLNVFGINKHYTDEGTFNLEDVDCSLEEDDDHPDGRIVSVYLTGAPAEQTKAFSGEIRFRLQRSADESLVMADAFTISSPADGERLDHCRAKSFGLHEGEYDLILMSDDMITEPESEQSKEWLDEGLCPECGGELIRHFFGARCTKCGARYE